jgi:hypothetical protein
LSLAVTRNLPIDEGLTEGNQIRDGTRFHRQWFELKTPLQLAADRELEEVKASPF